MSAKKQIIGKRRTWGRVSFLMSARVTSRPRLGGEWWLTVDNVLPIVLGLRTNAYVGDIVVSFDVVMGREPSPPEDSIDSGS